jgi:hypothetical protein
MARCRAKSFWIWQQGLMKAGMHDIDQSTADEQHADFHTHNDALLLAATYDE